MLKKALVAAAIVSGMAGTNPVSLSEQSVPVTQQATTVETEGRTESVQDMYRPVLKERIPGCPKQRGDKAWQWWTEQIRRIKYGWFAPDGHFLCGYHYWYLNFVKIPRQDNRTKKIDGWDAPEYRDNDDEILSILWQNRYRELPNGKTINARNHIQAKPRTIGWTQMEFLGVDSYHFIFTPGRSRFIGRGYPDDENIAAERSWFKMLYLEHIPEFLKTWKGEALEIVIDNDEEFAVGWKKGKTIIRHNAVLYKIISDDTHAGVFKGIRCQKITAVEAGKWKGNRLKNFWVENKDCLEGGDLKWGPFVIGGTSNQIINKSTDYKDMYFNPTSIGIGTTTHFTPKTKGMLGFVDLHTGRSEVERAYAYIMSRRKAASTDPELYQKELVENPLTPQEAFEPSLSFSYDQAKINAHIGYVKAHDLQKLWVQCRFEYIKDAYGHTIGVEPVPDENGPWSVNLEAKPRKDLKNLFVAGIDDTYVSLAEGQVLKARDSRDCMIIYCRESSLLQTRSGMPAAMYYDKANDTFITYEEFFKGMLYYNVEQVTYEFNHEAFYNWMRERNEAWRLTWVGNRPGLQIKGGMKSEVTRLGYQYLAKDMHKNITNLKILDSLLVWGSKENTDIGSAFHCLLYQLNVMKDWPVEYIREERNAENQYGPGREIFPYGRHVQEHRIPDDYHVLGRGNSDEGYRQADNDYYILGKNAGYYAA
nr:hypothetical protein [uncultured Arsenicibacter sp.]